MAEQRNYFLGYGERLTVPVDIASGGGPKQAPYSFEEARSRIVPMWARVTNELDALPEQACPRGQAVASVILHPEYYAKSYFPAGFLRSGGLRAIGSRPRKIRLRSSVVDAYLTKLLLQSSSSLALGHPSTKSATNYLVGRKIPLEIHTYPRSKEFR